VRGEAAPDVGYFFIGGAHKSGTTWIQRMLNAHPHVGVVGEGGFVGAEVGVDDWLDPAGFRRWLDGRDEDFAWMRGVDPARLDLGFRRALITTLMHARFPKEGVRRFGDKSPYVYNVQCERLHALFPDAWFIDVVRDGRDVVVSHLFHMLKLRYSFGADSPATQKVRRYWIEGKGDAVPLFPRNALKGLAEMWRVSVAGGRRARQLFGDRYLEVRYEAALADPHAVVRRMLEHLGVRARDYIVDHCVEQHRFQKVAGREQGEEDRTSFFRKGVAGDWVNYFTDKDRIRFKEQAGELLVELGYAADGDW